MTRRLLKLVVLLIVAMPVAASAQQKPTDDEKAKAAASYELAKPGPEHQQLAALAGKWDVEVKVWMAPGGQPMNFKGKCENRMILGGRFLVSESKSEGQMPIESTTIIGFDRRSKKYTTVGLDTGGTYWVTAAGPYDAAKKAIVMYGEDEDPALGTQKYYFVTRVTSPDKYVTEVIFTDSAHTKGAPEFKAVELTYTRTK